MNKEDKLRIIGALHNEARRLEAQAKQRSNAGPRLAGYRAGLREEAANCDNLAADIRTRKVKI